MTARKTGLTRRQPAEFGTIRERNGKFQTFFRLDGATHRAPGMFRTRAAARAWLGEQERAVRAGTFDPGGNSAPPPLTVAEFARDWLASRTDLAPRTVDHYRGSLDRWILPRLGDAAIAAVTVADVRRWRTESLAAAAADAAGEQAVAGSAARAWAQAQGLTVPRTGRLSRAVMEAWVAAGSPVPGKRRRPGDGSAAIATAYGHLRAIMAAAEREEVITRNPCRIPGAGASRARARNSPDRKPDHAAKMTATR